MTQAHYRFITEFDYSVARAGDLAYKNIVVTIMKVERTGESFVFQESVLAVCYVIFGTSEWMSGNRRADPSDAFGYVVECSSSGAERVIFFRVDI